LAITVQAKNKMPLKIDADKTNIILFNIGRGTTERQNRQGESFKE
jgi:hypothetical protein